MIVSNKNPLIKRLRALRDKTDRDRQGVFVIEGDKEISYALGAGLSFETVVYCSTLMGNNKQLNSIEQLRQLYYRQHSSDKAPAVQFVEVSAEVFAKVAYRGHCGGWLAIAHTPHCQLDDIKVGNNAFLLVVVNLEKPGNAGALLRSADAAGVDAVIFADTQVDLYNPNVVRASIGALFTLPCVSAASQEVIGWLRKGGINMVLARPQADVDYFDVDYTGPTAVVLGSEHAGLGGQWLKQPNTTQVRIPMRGAMDSLNVSVSGAVLMYEVLRQRTTIKTNGQ